VIARSSIVFSVLGLAFLAAVGNAPAVVRRDDQPDSLYRSLGRSAAFKSVGRVEIDYGRGYEAIGTATLYGRDRVVSAAHVFDDSSLAGARRVRINFGKGRTRTIDFSSPGVVNINPRYNSRTLKNDVSVAFLSRPFKLAPARIYTGRKLSLDSRITFVGYGDTGTGLSGSSTYSTKKRGGENAVGRYLLRGRDFEVDFDRAGTSRYNSLGSPVAMRLEGLLGPGDSGGSAWVFRSGRWQMVGINSYGLDWFPRGNGNGVSDDYGDRSGFVYLPRYSKWLDSLSNPSAQTASRSISAQLAAVPEPGTAMLVAAAGLVGGLLLRRRRNG